MSLCVLLCEPTGFGNKNIDLMEVQIRSVTGLFHHVHLVHTIKLFPHAH